MANKASGQVTVVDITDAYSVLLTSESYTFVGGTTGAPSGLSCTTQAVAYCGTQQCSNISVSTVTCPAGISATISNNNTVSPTITFKTTATITAACEATIPVVVDGVTVNKKFSFAVAKQGTQGDKGATGKGISSVTPQYYISTSKTSATGGSWSDIAPTTVEKGKYLWTRMKVVYTNPASTEYTTATYDSMTDSRIEQLKDSITLEITGPDGVKSSIAMDDEGKIALTGDVMAQRINVDELMAKHLTSTGGLDVTGGFTMTDSGYTITKKNNASQLWFGNDTNHSSNKLLTGMSVERSSVHMMASDDYDDVTKGCGVSAYMSGWLDIWGKKITVTNPALGDNDAILEVEGEVQATGKLGSNGSWALLQKWDSDKGYNGIMCGDGNDQVYLRTTAAGLIPYSSGGASTLGTSAWPFNEAYVTKACINTIIGPTVFDGANIQINTTELWRNGRSIAFGEWTPTIYGATVNSYTTQQGWYLKFGNVVIVGWYLYAKFASNQTSNKYIIQGLPYTPAAAGSGGGVCSGYYSANQINFSGWYAGRNGRIYGYGITNGAAGNKWAEEKIYCGTGDSYSTGTIIYTTTTS